MKIVSAVKGSWIWSAIAVYLPLKVFLASCLFFFFWQYMKKTISKRPMSFSLQLKFFSRGCFSSSITTMSTSVTGKISKVSLQLGSLQSMLCMCQIMSLCLWSLLDVHLTTTLSRELPSLIILDESVKCCCATLLEMYWFDSVPVGYCLNPRLVTKWLGFIIKIWFWLQAWIVILKDYY